MQVEVHQAPQTWVSYAITIVVLIVVVALRMRRMGKMRPLKLETLWVVPAIYLGVALLMFVQIPPKGAAALVTAVGLVIGAAVGWQRGKMMQIHVDPETHALNQKASPVAMIFLLILIAVRMLGRGVLDSSGVSPAMVTDPLVAFALGMFSLTRVEMYLRAKRLLEEARARA